MPKSDAASLGGDMCSTQHTNGCASIATGGMMLGEWDSQYRPYCV